MIRDYSKVPAMVTLSNTTEKDVVINFNNIPLVLEANTEKSVTVKNSAQLAILHNRVADLCGIEITEGKVAEVATAEDVKNALADPEVKNIVLTEDLTDVTKVMTLDHDVTIDGNGKTITADSAIFRAEAGNVILKNVTIKNTKGSAVTVTKGGSAIVDSTAVIESEKCCVAVLDENSSAEVYGSLTSTTDACIAGNGTMNGTTLNIYEGAKITSGDIALYIPQDGTVNIYGGEIVGKTAIGIKAGTLNIFGGTIVGNGEKLDPLTSNDGMKPWGDTIAVEVNEGYAGGKEDNNIKIHIAEEANVTCENADIIRVLNTAGKEITVTGAFTNATTEGNITVYTK